MKPHRPTLDEDSASRMLQGLVHPDDAPPGYSSVAGLLATAAQLPSLDEDAGAATISAMVEVIRVGAPAPQTSRRKSMLGKIFAGKALVAMATVALTASGAAAAAGSLPLVQDVVADTVSHVGVDIPKAAKGKSAEHRQDGEHRQSDKGQSGDEHGKPADDGGDDATENKGSTISDLTHSLEGPHKGPIVCLEASDGKCAHDKPVGEGTADDGVEKPGQKPADAGPAKDHDDSDVDGDATPPVTTGSKATGEDRSNRDGDTPAKDNPAKKG